MVSKATVWCGRHAHWLLLWYVLLLLLLFPFLSSLSSFNPTLWSVIHRKRGRTGIKSESVGNRQGKHASEGAAEWGGCHKACLCGVSMMTHFPSVCSEPQNVILNCALTLNSLIPSHWSPQPPLSTKFPPDCCQTPHLVHFFSKKQMHYSVPTRQPLQSHVLKVFWVVRDWPKQTKKQK